MVNVLECKILPVTSPTAIVDNASWTTNIIDTYGFDWVTFVVQMGATDIAMAVLKLQESDDSGMSGATDVVNGNFATGVGADGVATAVPSATDDNKLFAIHVNVAGHKRYLDLVATGGDGATGAYMSAIAILSRGKESPGTAAERGYTKELFA